MHVTHTTETVNTLDKVMDTMFKYSTPILYGRFLLTTIMVNLPCTVAYKYLTS